MSLAASEPLFTYSLAHWGAEPMLAFEAFLQGYRFKGRGLRRSSFVIYTGMFSRLRQWGQTQGLALTELDALALQAFLDERGLSPESRHRYLLLFTALFAHLARLRPTDPVTEAPPAGCANPARLLLLQTEAPPRADLAWLEDAEVSAFIEALPTGTSWKRVRDRAMAHLVLGAGLRCREVLTLQAQDLVFDQAGPSSVHVRAHAPHPARQPPLSGPAQQAMQRWLTQRASLAPAGALLFPADTAGATLAPVTLFRLVKNTLHRAGLSKRYEGPTLLRNSCGVRWLRTHELTQVMLWMGHATVRTTELLLPPEQRASNTAALAAQCLGAFERAPASARDQTR